MAKKTKPKPRNWNRPLRGPDTKMLSPKQIELDDWNYRDIDKEYVKQLKKEILQDGKVNKAIWVIKKSKSADAPYFLRGGEHRYQAVKELHEEGFKHILLPALSMEQGSLIDQLTFSFRDNTNRSDTVLEIAEMANRMLATNDNDGKQMTEKKVAERMSFAPLYVRNLIYLANAPKEIHQLLKQNTFKGTWMMEILRTTKDYDGALKYIMKILKENNINSIEEAKGKKLTKKKVEKNAVKNQQSAKSISELAHAEKSEMNKKEVFKHVDNFFTYKENTKRFRVKPDKQETVNALYAIFTGKKTVEKLIEEYLEPIE